MLGMGALQRKDSRATRRGSTEAVDSSGVAPLMYAFSIDDSPWSTVDIAGTVTKIAGFNGGT
jgi:hypothetical protein